MAGFKKGLLVIFLALSLICFMANVFCFRVSGYSLNEIYEMFLNVEENGAESQLCKIFYLYLLFKGCAIFFGNITYCDIYIVVLCPRK